MITIARRTMLLAGAAALAASRGASAQTDVPADPSYPFVLPPLPYATSANEPVIDAQTALAALDERIAESKKTEETAAADEARDRENLTALKGNDAAKRFVDELNHAEDQLQAARKQTADLEQQKEAAESKLNGLIAGLSFDWDVTSK